MVIYMCIFKMNTVKIKHFLCICIVLLMLAYAGEVFTKSNQIFLLDINGPIGPATRDFMIDGIEQAEENDAELVILRLDTPGGLSESMRDMIKKILNSEVAIATWVGPSGSRAASAGTYIMYASHINAMAPSTHLGAATPVAITGGKNPFNQTKKDKDNESDTEDDTEIPVTQKPTLIDKAIEDAVAYIRSLAEHRGRNADWAETAVRSAASLSSDQALENNVIDMIAHDIESLLNQVDGLTVSLPNQTKKLSVKGSIVTIIEPNWQNKFLATITNPTLAYILLLIGLYGLILEGYNPGALVPGVIGGICLLVALYAFQILPVNFAGLALILLGFTLITIEFFVPAFGILGIGGMVAFSDEAVDNCLMCQVSCIQNNAII